MIAATKTALSKNEKYVEVLFDPVPNLDEVAFGTEWNKKLRLEVAANLGVPDYACNRGGPATLEWSNIYWMNRLVSGLGGKKPIVGLSISGEGIRGQFKPMLDKSITLMNLADAKRGITGEIGMFVLLSPCSEAHYSDGKALADKYNVPIIALNSPYSFRYDIGMYNTCRSVCNLYIYIYIYLNIYNIYVNILNNNIS